MKIFVDVSLFIYLNVPMPKIWYSSSIPSKKAF